MNSEEVKRIEAAIGVSLPPHYVDLVTNYPAQLLETDAQDFALLNDPEMIIQENLAVRGRPFYGRVWPENYFIIGTNGCGDLYVTALSAQEFSVGFFDHEKRAFFPHSNSREQFISKVLQESNAAGI